MNLSGVFPALTTPFSADGSVSVADIKHNISKYNATGLAGYVAIGSTGESVLLSRKEVDTVLVAVKESAAPGMKLLSPERAPNPPPKPSTAQNALPSLAIMSRLVKTPYYYKPIYKRGNVHRALPARRGCLADSCHALFRSAIHGHSSRSSGSWRTRTASEYHGHQGKFRSGATRRGNACRCSGIVSTVGRLSEHDVSVDGAWRRSARFLRWPVLCRSSASPFLMLRVSGHLDKARELQSGILEASKADRLAVRHSGVKYAMDQAGYKAACHVCRCSRCKKTRDRAIRNS